MISFTIAGALIRKFYSHIVVNKLLLALQWYIHVYTCLLMVSILVCMLWLALHLFDVMLIRKRLSAI